MTSGVSIGAVVALGLFAGSIGCVLGAYLATVAIRYRFDPVAHEYRSRCDHCKRVLGFAETIPIVSGTILRMRCRTCHGRIDPIHLWGEAAGGIGVALAILTVPFPQSVLVSALSFLLLGLALIDIKTMRLPNAWVLAVASVAGLLCVLSGTALTNLVAAAVTWALMKALQWVLKRRLGHEALGSGDIKLCAALALWLGVSMPYMLLIACASALAFMMITGRKGRLPFGPFITGAGFVIGWALEAGLMSWVAF